MRGTTMRAEIQLPAHGEASPERFATHWQAERGYYDSACGATYVTPEPGLPTWIEVWRDDGRVRCGYHTDGARHAWIRSSGTWAALDGRVLIVSGRRHAIADLLRSVIRSLNGCEYRIIESQRADLAPWETAT